MVSNRLYPDYNSPQVIFGGLRSYTLMALLGAVSVYLGEVLGHMPLVFMFTGITLFLFIIVSYSYSAFKQHQFGVTSEFAALTVFLL